MTSSRDFDANNLLSDVDSKINHLSQIITEYSMWENKLSKSKGIKRPSVATIFEEHKQNKKQKKILLCEIDMQISLHKLKQSH